MRVSIKGDRMLMIPGGEWRPLTIKLDPAKSPKILNMAPLEGREKGKTVPARYRLDKAAETLTLCWDAKDGNAAPEDIAAKKSSGLMLLLLKHELRAPVTKGHSRRLVAGRGQAWFPKPDLPPSCFLAAGCSRLRSNLAVSNSSFPSRRPFRKCLCD